MILVTKCCSDLTSWVQPVAGVWDVAVAGRIRSDHSKFYGVALIRGRWVELKWNWGVQGVEVTGCGCCGCLVGIEVLWWPDLFHLIEPMFVPSSCYDLMKLDWVSGGSKVLHWLDPAGLGQCLQWLGIPWPGYCWNWGAAVASGGLRFYSVWISLDRAFNGSLLLLLGD